MGEGLMKNLDNQYFIIKNSVDGNRNESTNSSNSCIAFTNESLLINVEII